MDAKERDDTEATVGVTGDAKPEEHVPDQRNAAIGINPEPVTNTEPGDSRPAERISAGDGDPGPATERKVPTDGEVAAKLHELLSDDNLSLNVTERQLRARLEEHFGIPLKDRKSVIRAEVVEWLSRKQNGGQEAAEGSGDEEAAPAPKRTRRVKKQPLLSEALQTFLGVERMDRFQVTKQIWAHIKGNNLQNPSDKRVILPDEKLETIFTFPLHMMQIAKQLSKHIFTDDTVEEVVVDKRKRGADEDGEKDEDEQDEDAPGLRKKKPRKASGGGGGGKKGGAFTKPLLLTPEMREWFGPGEATRGQLTKHFYAYIKDHNLKDPSNGSFVLCDDALTKLTGQKRIKSFGAIKYLNKHVLGYADEEGESALADGEENKSDDQQASI